MSRLARQLPSLPPSLRVSGRLARVLGAVFLFNLGVAAWSAVVAGHLAENGHTASLVGTLYAVSDFVRLPAAFLLPAVTLRFGTRRVTLVGLVGLLGLPLLLLPGDGTLRVMTLFVVSALPAMAIYVGLPSFVIGAAEPGRDGWALAWLGLAGGAGGGLGPFIGGMLADRYGLFPALLLLALAGALLLPIVLPGRTPPPTPWQGWGAVMSAGSLPWRALAALALASAADAGRAALVPTELVQSGLSLSQTGLLLGIAAALAGTGFLAFGRLVDRHSANRVVGAGLLVLVAGSFAAAVVASWSLGYAMAAAVLGMGASGVRLGAEVSLIGWLGRDRAGVAAALGETTIVGGRMVGAPVVGALGDARGGAYAFSAIGAAGLMLGGVFALIAVDRLRRAAAVSPRLSS